MEDANASFHGYCSEYLHQPMAVFHDQAGGHQSTEFSRMLEYMQSSGTHFLVLVPDATHLGRGLQSIAAAMAQLEAHKAKVQCMDEEFPDPLQSALHYIGRNGDSKKHSLRVKNAMLAKAQLGLGLGRTPYGYSIGTDGRFEVVPEEASTVRLIFDLYVNEGLGLRKIVEHLNSNAISSRSGSAWNIVTVRDILKNIAYIGTYGRFGFRIPKNHPRIVPNETFRQAQAAMRQKRPRRTTANVEPYLLSGLVFCGYCGNKMIGSSRRQAWRRKDRSRAKNTYRYYQCQSRANQSACKYHTWRASVLEDQVLQEMKAAHGAGLLVSSPASSASPSGSRVKVAQRRFLWAFKTAAEGQMSIPTLASYLEALTQAREPAPGSDGAGANNHATPESLDKWAYLPISERQELLESFTERIVVRDDRIEVHFRSA